MSHQYNLPQSSRYSQVKSDILIPNTKNPQKAIEYINSYIDKVVCEEFAVDISLMNTIDACYVSTMCSTKHYIKYPAGKISWFVCSNQVEEFSKDMSLGNCSYYSIR